MCIYVFDVYRCMYRCVYVSAHGVPTPSAARELRYAVTTTRCVAPGGKQCNSNDELIILILI